MPDLNDLIATAFGPGPPTAAQPRRYFSARSGRQPDALALDLPMLKRLFRAVYEQLEREGYFQQALGYYCVDARQIHGACGADVGAFFLRRLRKGDLWPIEERLAEYREDDLFDVIELLFDLVSCPDKGYHHTFSDCGWHYDTFDRRRGQERLRAEINDLLADYQDGWELSRRGEILARGKTGLRELFTTELPKSVDRTNVKARVEHSVLQFRRRGSSLDDRRQAVRELADVLEFLRPQLKQVMTKRDEGDLFNIANNFGLRHHNDRQQTDYDHAIWQSWMFHFYLATIHMATRRLAGRDE